MSIRNRPIEPRKLVIRRVIVFSGVNKRDHDISCALCHIEALVIVGEASRMHEHPSNLCLCDLAVVSEEPTTTALEN